MGKLQTGMLIGLLLPALAFARKPDREVQAPWAKLSKLVKGKDAEVKTTSGTSIFGTIRRVTADALELDQHRQVPRAEVRSLRLDERHGHWRLGGTLIGLFGSAAILSTTGKDKSGDATAAQMLVPWVAGLAGYFVGREIDKQALLIEVLP